MGKVIMSGIVPTLKAPVTYNANFADNDWATIIKACHKNQVPETWVVGNQKAMTINGADYVIDIIGKNHDDYADGSGKAVIFIVFVVEIIVFEVAADLILRFDIGLRGIRLPRYEIIIERLIINVADIREQSLFRQIIGAGRGADKHLLLQIRDRIRHRIGIS